MSMKMEELLQLIDAVSESNLTELEYKDENAEISLKKKLQPIQSAQQTEEVSCTEEIVQQKAILNKMRQTDWSRKGENCDSTTGRNVLCCSCRR